MNLNDYKGALQNLNASIKGKHLSEALQQVNQLLKAYPYSVSLLVKRAMLIQVQDESSDLPPLEEARRNLELAIELEPHSVETLIELGNFDYAVADHSESAIVHFERAISESEMGLKAAMVGMIKSQIELGLVNEAQASLERSKTLFPDDLDILMLQDELPE